MVDGSFGVAFYTPLATTRLAEVTVRTCECLGVDVRYTAHPLHEEFDEESYGFRVEYDDSVFVVRYNLKRDRTPQEPALQLGTLTDHVFPSSALSDEQYSRRMDTVFELVCRLAMNVKAEYVSLYNTNSPRAAQVLPFDRPIGAAVERAPRLGIYSEPVLADFGGVDGLFESPPWYVGTLEDGRTVVVESEAPWADGGWRPPSAAAVEYVRESRFPGDVATDGGSVGLSDPFASLEPGDYGADACVCRDDVASEFRNEDLELVRAYVDEQGDLRRVADNSFVRNVVAGDAEDRVTLIKRQLAEIPAEAAEGDLMVSALLHEAIPPSFVRLDGPDGENVVTRVLDLDVDTNKVELLISLGRAAQHGDGMDVVTIESALEELAGLEDSDGVDRWIEQNLL